MEMGKHYHMEMGIDSIAYNWILIEDAAFILLHVTTRVETFQLTFHISLINFRFFLILDSLRLTEQVSLFLKLRTLTQ